MKRFANLIKQITLGKLLVSLSAVSLVFAFLLVFVLSGYVRERAVHDLAREDARQASGLVFQSLYSAMRKGWNKDEIKDAIDRLNSAMPEGLVVRVYRGAVVEKQFGAMAGEHEQIAQDTDLQMALQNGQDVTLFPSSGSIRYLYPVRATKECLACHTQSYEGAVHGVIDITYPVHKIKVSLDYVLNSIVGYTFLVLGLVFIALYVKLRYLVATPISDLVNVIQRITQDMNLSHRVEGGQWIVELRRLSEYFNRLMSTVEDYNYRLQELSVRDPLTGLYNRRKFEEFLDYEIIRAERHGHAFSIIMADLDDFKFINDTYGHPVGDMALKKLALLLEGCLRKGDVMARLGGDEFAVILPETAMESGLQVAHKLHHTLGNSNLELPVGKVSLAASFSVVNYPLDGKTKAELLTAMDVVLYKAKSRGKNQVLGAGASDENSEMSIFRQADFLRRALSEDRVEAFFQPIVDVYSGETVAFESLARIREGDVWFSAGQFIETAESLGMSKELDVRVFEKALDRLAVLKDTHPQAKMFFNLSARTFNNVAWMRSIPQLAAERGIACNKLVLEITEREALPNMTQVKEVIDELRKQRVAFALDDFGSGFSSFLYLKYLSVDYVKIEGSFVRQIARDERDRVMVHHIHMVAKAFGLKTVAEFVEDAETAEILGTMGVDFAQGYYYGKPMQEIAAPAQPALTV